MLDKTFLLLQQLAHTDNFDPQHPLYLGAEREVRFLRDAEKIERTVVARDSPAGARALSRWQKVYDAGDESRNQVQFWMQVAYEFFLDIEEAKDT